MFLNTDNTFRHDFQYTCKWKAEILLKRISSLKMAEVCLFNINFCFCTGNKDNWGMAGVAVLSVDNIIHKYEYEPKSFLRKIIVHSLRHLMSVWGCAAMVTFFECGSSRLDSRETDFSPLGCVAYTNFCRPVVRHSKLIWVAHLFTGREKPLTSFEARICTW